MEEFYFPLICPHFFFSGKFDLKIYIPYIKKIKKNVPLEQTHWGQNWWANQAQTELLLWSKAWEDVCGEPGGAGWGAFIRPYHPEDAD